MVTVSISNNSKGSICSTTLIVISRVLEKECEFNNSLKCDIDVINEQRKEEKKMIVEKLNTEIPITSSVPTLSKDREPNIFGIYQTFDDFQPRTPFDDYTTQTTPYSVDSRDKNIKYSIYVNKEVILMIMSFQKVRYY
jgi:hypothetical protein